MNVEVAFIDKDDKLLQSRFFPNKIGGLPAWLDLKFLPTTKEILCNMCGLPKTFLCQLYSPVEDKDSAFHRTIFVFLCLSENCFQPGSNKNFTVFRNQLPAQNPYYPETAEGIELRTDITCNKFGLILCGICGIRGDVSCEHCEALFCSDFHRKFHKHGENSKTESISDSTRLLPEYGMSYEEEILSDDDSESSNSDEEEHFEDDSAVKNLCQRLSQFDSPQDNAALEEIFAACSEVNRDETFSKFKNRISYYPDQILRYSRNNPLWLSDKHQPLDGSIPPCEYCHSPRQFEFQILPQLLNYLNLDAGKNLASGVLDWGTLAVYTCRENCDDGPAYKKEYLWKQDLL